MMTNQNGRTYKTIRGLGSIEDEVLGSDEVIEMLRIVMKHLWGEVIDSEAMTGTPERVFRHWKTITNGLNQDPSEPLSKTFPCEHDEIVLVSNIPIFSLCEHHLLPFYGEAHVAYIPQGRVVGLSKIPRCLDVLASRPQLQERLTEQAGKVLWDSLQPKGLAVVIRCDHTCMTTRGVLKPGSKTTTSCLKGIFKDDASARAEVMTLIG